MAGLAVGGLNGWVVASAPLSLPLRDPDDEPFLEIAVSGGADYLVTGNAAHFPPELCQGTKVVSPADFLKRGVKRPKIGKGRT
jgi:predicted nucleic acid-binding protein